MSQAIQDLVERVRRENPTVRAEDQLAMALSAAQVGMYATTAAESDALSAAIRQAFWSTDGA
jgi:hypothetical protein